VTAPPLLIIAYQPVHPRSTLILNLPVIDGEPPVTARIWPISIGASVLIFAALLLSSQVALAQFTQQGPKLVATGAVDSFFGVQQGSSVALSTDGNTALVGELTRIIQPIDPLVAQTGVLA
jgi:hypothetical protein